MNDTSKQVANAAAKANGWDIADVAVDEIPDGTAGDCKLYSVRSNNALPSISTTYAVIGGNQIVAPGDNDALVRVLDACGPDASASLWADAIVAFQPGILPGRVARREENISSVAHKWAMQNGGYSFHAPRFSTETPDRRTVEFFMSDVEGNQLFQARGSRHGNGPVEVAVEPAGTR